MLRFDRAGLDEKPVSVSRLERIGSGVTDDWLHALNAPAIRKDFDRGRIRVRFQFPNGEGILVALKSGYGNDFYGGQSVRASEAEIDVTETLIVRDKNNLRLEPVAEIDDIKGAKSDQNSDENPTFFIHKQNERRNCFMRRTTHLDAPTD